MTSRGGRVCARNLLLAAAIGALGWFPSLETNAQTPDAALARDLDRMSPAERVGQLFLVPFDGNDASEGSALGQLIREAHVGGVIVSAQRGNFDNGPDTPTQVARLTNAIQELSRRPDGFLVPAFIAVAQKGNAYPGSEMRGGMTALPSSMAIGATWDPGHAERIGEIIGRELAAVGVNLLLGPDLDVMAVPQPGSSGDLGALSFGGSPHWVGRMGTRFIEGVHLGGKGRVATATGHFPGIGGADRSAEDDVAVVEQSYQQLSSLELVPFSSVTGESWSAGVTDAVVTSHVRYRGVQQQIERPLSLDSGGLRYLMGQMPSLSGWRNGLGGVMISPGLGVPAVRRYDDPELRSFNHRRVIREALAAGHDVLLVAGFGDDPTSEAAAIRDGIAWLTGVYEEDEAVRDAVDRAVERVVALKRRMAPLGTLAEARVDASTAAAKTGLGTEDVQAIA